MDVELGSESNLQVPDALLLVIDRELIGRSFQGDLALHDPDCVGESLEILSQVCVAIFKHGLSEPGLRVARQRNIILLSKFDQSAWSN